MGKHVLCITTGLLGVDVDFATRVARDTWWNDCVTWPLNCYLSCSAIPLQ